MSSKKGERNYQHILKIWQEALAKGTMKTNLAAIKIVVVKIMKRIYRRKKKRRTDRINDKL